MGSETGKNTIISIIFATDFRFKLYTQNAVIQTRKNYSTTLEQVYI